MQNTYVSSPNNQHRKANALIRKIQLKKFQFFCGKRISQIENVLQNQNKILLYVT